LYSAIKNNPRVTAVAAAPGNAGIAALGAYCYSDVKATDISALTKCAADFKADFVIVAPDDPLVLGAVDALDAAGFKCFGPKKDAAIIEGSKSFSKHLMKKHQIPTADYREFINTAEATAYLENADYPIVIKADGLALGKGVTIANTFDEAVAAVSDCLDNGKFGFAGKRVVIEEYLSGVEVTVLCLTDGADFIAFPASTDHKRAFDNDLGPNTGGMGVIAPAPYYTSEIREETIRNIITPTLNALRIEGRLFRGCLYFGLMLTGNGVKVVEYNARFGDPEAQTVLPLLNENVDLIGLFEACRSGILREFVERNNLRGKLFKNLSSACVVMASGGYPDKYQTGLPITGIDFRPPDRDVFVNYAGVSVKDGKPHTSGGRVLTVTALDKDLSSALKKAYSEISHINFEGAHFRNDIGYKAIEFLSLK
jgi:phosphoribosylamine--glycine ligase